MASRHVFGQAVAELTVAHERQTSLCTPFLNVIPADSAVISTFGSAFDVATVCASDPRAARFDEMQFDLGEGPGWTSLNTRAPVAVHDLQSPANSLWPALLKAVDADGVRGVSAFPLMLGSLLIGAVGLYTWRPGTLTEPEKIDAGMLASIVARQVLRRSLAAQPSKTGAGDNGSHSRRVVHQATGMVLAQLNLSAADALLIIHGHAFSNGRTVREVAADVVARRLDLSSMLDS
ncbi:GAF and ANTAR domain-containing protein [Cryobacterium psychrophilum]|uniref:ANTAR domain-containing protein n=1 Tax=Cryobacterium psychrophilum TaxID=41988 RepID=A0A4Y8KW57_9MICO|nr:GAF and ANTAR domain-containing protein [Cryobacterium psychrophilum]TDW28452.1 ANTAR domain-containing protein [Cryobacterium psychrophilum]TFD80554.1 ANTAR domain-containing protein [Cryobacterium psychrophilum]